jgi:predicted transcriptional regulator
MFEAVAVGRGEEPPQHIVVRMLMPFLLRFINISARLQGGNPASTLIFLTIAHANVEHLGRDRGMAWNYAQEPSDEVRRPISVHALAQSLTFPPETTRRHVHKMIARGMCRRVGEGGVIATQAYLASPEVVAAMAEIVDNFDRLIADFHSVGADLGSVTDHVPAPAMTADDPRNRANMIFHAVCKFALKVIVNGLPLYEDIMANVVFTAVFSANTRDIAVNPKLTWRYAADENVAPDHIRKPVTVRELATSLAIPYSTVYRQVLQMVEKGMLIRRDGGVVLPRQIILMPDMIAAGDRMRTWFFAMLRDLKAEGQDPLVSA